MPLALLRLDAAFDEREDEEVEDEAFAAPVERLALFFAPPRALPVRRDAAVLPHDCLQHRDCGLDEQEYLKFELKSKKALDFQ